MTTDYNLRATIAVPVAHIADANQLAICLGQSAADDETFGAANFQDAEGNLYAVSSTVARESFPTEAGQPLQAPAYSPNVDLTAATRAQALVQINDCVATRSVIAVILSATTVTALDHVAALGLTRVPQEDPL